MKYHFEIDKVIQAIGVLFRSDHVNRMSYLRLLKLLYIADRESLGETGWAITRDRVVAMDNGPVLSHTYDLIMGRHVGAPRWSSFFRKAHYWLEKISEPDVGKLSKYEITKLQEVAQRYEDRTEWDMVEVTHEFSEWKKNNPFRCRTFWKGWEKRTCFPRLNKSRGTARSMTQSSESSL